MTRSVEDTHAGGCGWYSCREKPRAVSLSTNAARLASPWQLLGLSPTVCEPQVLPWLQPQQHPLAVYCGCFRPLEREAEKSHLQDYFEHVLYL